MVDFCDAMLRNNSETGNLGSLVALTVATVDEVRALLCVLLLFSLVRPVPMSQDAVSHPSVRGCFESPLPSSSRISTKSHPNVRVVSSLYHPGISMFHLIS